MTGSRRTRPPAPSEIKKRRQRAHAALASRFFQDNADAHFRPEDWSDGPDYNIHHVWLEADLEAEAEFSRIALAIVRGELDDKLDEVIDG